MNPTTPTTSWNDTQKLLAFIVVVAFIGVIFWWIAKPPDINSASTAVLNTLVGTLGGFAAMVLTFYFGSSRSDRAKDGTIATALAAPPQNGNGGGDHAAAPVAPPKAPAG